MIHIDNKELHTSRSNSNGIALEINPLSEIALYEQIAEQLKQMILNGILAEHTPLPSVRGLAQTLGISVITTRRAYTELEQQGYIITIPAKGSFVSFRYRERLKELGKKKLNEMIADVTYLAKALQIDEAALLEQVSTGYRYAQQHDYNQLKARQNLSQLIRK